MSRCKLIFESNLTDRAETVNSGYNSICALEPAFVQNVLGLTAESFRQAVTEAVLHLTSSKKQIHTAPEGWRFVIKHEDGLLRIYAAGGPTECVRCTVDPGSYRAASELHPAVLSKLCAELVMEGDADWYAENNKEPWLPLIGANPAAIRGIVDEMKKILYSPMNELLPYLGTTVAALSRDLMIPKRTVEDWVSGRVPCKHYTRMLIAQRYWLYK